MQISWRQRGLLVSVFLSHSIILLEEPGVSSRCGFPPQARHWGARGKRVRRGKEMPEQGKFSEEESKLTSSTHPPLPRGKPIPSLARRMRVNTFGGDRGTVKHCVRDMFLHSVVESWAWGQRAPRLGMIMQWGTEGDGDRPLCALKCQVGGLQGHHLGGTCCLCHQAAPRGAQAPAASCSAGTQSKRCLPSSLTAFGGFAVSSAFLPGRGAGHQNMGSGQLLQKAARAQHSEQAGRAMRCLGGASPSLSPSPCP